MRWLTRLEQDGAVDFDIPGVASRLDTLVTTEQGARYQRSSLADLVERAEAEAHRARTADIQVLNGGKVKAKLQVWRKLTLLSKQANRTHECMQAARQIVAPSMPTIMPIFCSP
jgi:hypothetical protein